MKISKKSILKKTCNSVAGLFSSAKKKESYALRWCYDKKIIDSDHNKTCNGSTNLDTF